MILFVYCDLIMTYVTAWFNQISIALHYYRNTCSESSWSSVTFFSIHTNKS